MKAQDSLETERTIMRNLTVEDTVDFYNLNLDQDVLKYTGDEAFETLEMANFFLSSYNQYEKYGVRRLAVIEKATSEFIGWCGLKYNTDEELYDLEFRFFKQYWNQDFATETAKKCLNFGFNNLKLNRIVGRAMNENIASIKVLEKIGMNFKESFIFNGHDGVNYKLRKQNKND